MVWGCAESCDPCEGDILTQASRSTLPTPWGSTLLQRGSAAYLPRGYAAFLLGTATTPTLSLAMLWPCARADPWTEARMPAYRAVIAGISSNTNHAGRRKLSAVQLAWTIDARSQLLALTAGQDAEHVEAVRVDEDLVEVVETMP